MSHCHILYTFYTHLSISSKLDTPTLYEAPASAIPVRPASRKAVEPRFTPNRSKHTGNGAPRAWRVLAVHRPAKLMRSDSYNKNAQISSSYPTGTPKQEASKVLPARGVLP